VELGCHPGYTDETLLVRDVPGKTHDLARRVNELDMMLHDDFADAIGELANMIAGSAKKDLGHTASISVPNVVIGGGHIIARLSEVPCLVIPCRTPVGNFAVEVNIKTVQS